LSAPAVVIEPEFVNERIGAAVMGVSPRTFVNLVRRGDIWPVRVPGVRRTVFALSELRELGKRWRAGDDQR
jgi:hypothetical protein